MELCLLAEEVDVLVLGVGAACSLVEALLCFELLLLFIFESRERLFVEGELVLDGLFSALVREKVALVECG